MTVAIKLKRGTSTAADAYVGAVGELVYVTDNKTVRVYDGISAGGTQLALNDVVLGVRDALQESGEYALSTKADIAELQALQLELQQQITDMPDSVVARTDQLYVKKTDMVVDDPSNVQYFYWS